MLQQHLLVFRAALCFSGLLHRSHAFLESLSSWPSDWNNRPNQLLVYPEKDSLALVLFEWAPAQVPLDLLRQVLRLQGGARCLQALLWCARSRSPCSSWVSFRVWNVSEMPSCKIPWVLEPWFCLNTTVWVFYVCPPKVQLNSIWVFLSPSFTWLPPLKKQERRLWSGFLMAARKQTEQTLDLFQQTEATPEAPNLLMFPRVSVFTTRVDMNPSLAEGRRHDFTSPPALFKNVSAVIT